MELEWLFVLILIIVYIVIVLKVSARFGLNEKIFTYARAGTQIICNVMDL